MAFVTTSKALVTTSVALVTVKCYKFLKFRHWVTGKHSTIPTCQNRKMSESSSSTHLKGPESKIRTWVKVIQNDCNSKTRHDWVAGQLHLFGMSTSCGRVIWKLLAASLCVGNLCDLAT